MEFRRIKPEDYKDIHALNEKLGYSYDGDKVYERIISILETGSDFITVAEDEGRVVGYIHGSPYETLYSDKLVNIVALVVSDDYADNEEARQIYDVFEARVRKNGYCGLRMTANVRRKNLFKLLSQHGFKSHSDLKHYLKYFD